MHKSSLEQQTEAFWLLSSFWNGRTESPENYTVGSMLEILNNLKNRIQYYKLWRSVGALLWEVITHGQKPKVAEQDEIRVVPLNTLTGTQAEYLIIDDYAFDDAIFTTEQG